MAGSNSPLLENPLSAFSFLSERGVLSGLYIGFFSFVIILDTQYTLIAPETYPWLITACSIFGLIGSSITYELLLFFFRRLTEPLILKAFYRTTENTDRSSISNYSALRRFRESFLSKDTPEHLRAVIQKEERLLQTLTYLASASLLAIGILVLANLNLTLSTTLFTLLLGIATYILTGTIVGEVTRSSSYGRALGIAYVLDAKNIDQNTAEPKNSDDKRLILCLDFDGVLHWYRNGWQGATVVDDIPVPGAQEFVAGAKQIFRVVVYSARSHQTGGIDAMQRWMKKHNFPEVEFPKVKPRASVLLDDHAITFEGKWPDPSDLLSFKPWRLKEKHTNNEQ